MNNNDATAQQLAKNMTEIFHPIGPKPNLEVINANEFSINGKGNSF